ncbi:MAG: hypothetical protein HON53_08420 [Planctomycetaceae bacterium]|nr:hypothetical protein [Planctomycetaceae bacterium]MBT6157151.1 hypothetical protein [Planctomycetaceae bacterium]MBT6483623.1 hypothetical protein [Planctomycetaceae bacterium]MBT6495771.1 hypothetical protein [Planctomycetaceae bacterium]
MIIALAGCILLHTAPVIAVEADAGLLRLVGEDAGLVVEVTGLSKELPKLEKCEVVKRLQQTILFRQWKASDDFGKLDASRTVIEKLVGISLRQMVDDVFGQSFVLAVYPTGKDETQAVLITQARSPDTLKSAVALWNRIERSKLKRATFEGYEYVRRTRTGPAGKPMPPQFYVVFDDVFAFSDNEAAIQRTITFRGIGDSLSTDGGTDLEAAKSRRHFLLSPAHQTAREELSSQRFVSLHLNPRAWDDRVDFGADKSKIGVFIADAWQRCDSIAFSLSVDERGILVEGVAHYDGRPNESVARIPAANIADSESLPAFLSRVPRRAIAAVAGRNDLADVARALIGWIPDEKQDDWSRLRQLGRGLLVGFGLFDDVLPALGHNWGAYVVASTSETVDQSPLDSVIGVELPPPGQVARGKITLRDGVDNALETTLRLIAPVGGAETDGKFADVETESTQSGTLVRSIKMGQSLQPGFAMTTDQLAIGTSPIAIKEFIGLDANNSLATAPAFRNTAKRYFPTNSQLLYVNVAALRGVIDEHELLLSARLSGSKEVSPEASAKRVEMLNDLLRAFDTVFVAAHADRRRFRLTWGITANPADGKASR